MKTYKKQNFPVSDIRRFLEPGPVVLVSSAWKGENNIMTMGWHMVMEFVPSLVACLISSGNHSHDAHPPQQGMRDQYSDAGVGADRREDRQLLGRRGRQVRRVQADRAARPTRSRRR